MTCKQSRKIDLSKLKAGDEVKFRNGYISKVEQVSYKEYTCTYPYHITFSEGIKETYTKDGLSIDGMGNSDDIIEINPEEQTTLAHDPVNHPSHYTDRVPGIECIDVVENFDFCLGGAIKYIWRAGLKDPTKEIEDLKKARWLLDREIQRLEKEAK